MAPACRTWKRRELFPGSVHGATWWEARARHKCTSRGTAGIGRSSRGKRGVETRGERPERRRGGSLTRGVANAALVDVKDGPRCRVGGRASAGRARRTEAERKCKSEGGGTGGGHTRGRCMNVQRGAWGRGSKRGEIGKGAGKSGAIPQSRKKCNSEGGVGSGQTRGRCMNVQRGAWGRGSKRAEHGGGRSSRGRGQGRAGPAPCR